MTFEVLVKLLHHPQRYIHEADEAWPCDPSHSIGSITDNPASSVQEPIRAKNPT